MKITWLLALVSVMLALGSLGGCAKIDDTTLDETAVVVGEVRELIGKQTREPASNTVILLDARRMSVYRQGAIPGAEAIDIVSIDATNKRVNPRIQKFQTKVVYGDNPGDAIAKAVAKKMLEAGYENVRWFPGGWEEWRRMGGKSATPDVK